jgi:hypothetical protein
MIIYIDHKPLQFKYIQVSYLLLHFPLLHHHAHSKCLRLTGNMRFETPLFHLLSCFILLVSAIPEAHDPASLNSPSLQPRGQTSAASGFRGPNHKHPAKLFCFIRPMNNFCTRECHCTPDNLVSCQPRDPDADNKDEKYGFMEIFGQSQRVGFTLNPEECKKNCACKTRRGHLILLGKSEKEWEKQRLYLKAQERATKARDKQKPFKLFNEKLWEKISYTPIIEEELGKDTPERRPTTTRPSPAATSPPQPRKSFHRKIQTEIEPNTESPPSSPTAILS